MRDASMNKLALRRIDEHVFVAGQIPPGAMETLAKSGITMIVNNRPDGEEPGQPPAAALAAAAAAAGLTHVHIPVSGGLEEEQVKAMAEALQASEGDLVAFCKSGMRSAWLWALASASLGDDPDRLVRAASDAGHDLTPLRPALQAFARSG